MANTRDFLEKLKNFLRENQAYKLFLKAHWFYFLLLLLLVIGVLLADFYSKHEVLPTFFVSLISLGVVYQSSLDSKNKLRLELFERRYEIYKEIIKFSSHTIGRGEVEEEAIKSAHESFRGLRYHESKFLFGSDVNSYFDEVNNAFSYLVSHRSPPNDPAKHQKWVEEKFDNLRFVTDITKQAPKLFRPYLYFGDIKGR